MLLMVLLFSFNFGVCGVSIQYSDKQSCHTGLCYYSHLTLVFVELVFSIQINRAVTLVYVTDGVTILI